MGHHFEAATEFEVPASVEEVWDAIATGPGVQSWFLGRTDVEPGVGGIVSMAMGEYRPRSEITAWEPGERFAHRQPPLPDGRFMAYEFLVEGRDRASTVVRMVTSGFLPGDDWADEYEAMRQGGAFYTASLREYLTHFAPRTCDPLNLWGEGLSTWDETRARLDRLLGIADGRAQADVDGIGRIDGVVFHENDQTIGIRTDDALYRFIHAIDKTFMLAHLRYAPGEQDWAGWLAKNFA